MHQPKPQLNTQNSQQMVLNFDFDLLKYFQPPSPLSLSLFSQILIHSFFKFLPLLLFNGIFFFFFTSIDVFFHFSSFHQFYIFFPWIRGNIVQRIKLFWKKQSLPKAYFELSYLYNDMGLMKEKKDGFSFELMKDSSFLK